MRDFSWNVFAMTGDVDAYLLYKEFDDANRSREDDTEEDGEPNNA